MLRWRAGATKGGERCAQGGKHGTPRKLCAQCRCATTATCLRTTYNLETTWRSWTDEPRTRTSTCDVGTGTHSEQCTECRLNLRWKASSVVVPITQTQQSQAHRGRHSEVKNHLALHSALAGPPKVTRGRAVTLEILKQIQSKPSRQSRNEQRVLLRKVQRNNVPATSSSSTSGSCGDTS